MKTIVLYDNQVSPQELAYLNCAMESMGHSAESLTLVPFRWLMSFNQADVFISLGIPLSRFMSDLKSIPYTGTPAGHSTFLQIDPLDKVLADTSLQRQFWRAIRSVYLTNSSDFQPISHAFLLASGFTPGRHFHAGTNQFTLYYQTPGAGCTIELRVGSRLPAAPSPEVAVEEYSDMALLIAHTLETYTVFADRAAIATACYQADLLQLLYYLAHPGHPSLRMVSMPGSIQIKNNAQNGTGVAVE